MCYNHTPKTKVELIDAIEEEITLQGLDANLNCIDTSAITDMSGLFSDYSGYGFGKFIGDISRWNVSNVTDMSRMFEGSLFCGYIGSWDVYSVQDMSHMFEDSQFNGTINHWDVSEVTNMSFMFSGTSIFDQDLSDWKVNEDTDTLGMFDNTNAPKPAWLD